MPVKADMSPQAQLALPWALALLLALGLLGLEARGKCQPVGPPPATPWWPRLLSIASSSLQSPRPRLPGGLL